MPPLMERNGGIAEEKRASKHHTTASGAAESPSGNMSTDPGKSIPKQAGKPSTLKSAMIAASPPGKNGRIDSKQQPRGSPVIGRKRFSLRFGGSKPSMPPSSALQEKQSNQEKESSEVDDASEIERDPVIELLEARATQKVRFSLDVSQTVSQERKGAPSENQDDPNPPSHSRIKSFMTRTLFGRNTVTPQSNEPEARDEIVWESGDSREFVQTRKGSKSEITLTFVENPIERAEIVKCLNKGRRAQYSHFQYKYALKCFLRALDLLNKAKYPEEHPIMLKTLRALSNAHHAVSAFNNSANIVKIGIRCEESGDLVRALKMYTVAYRIRRDNLSRAHPSLVILLNILASIQAKRGEYKEAMQIYELALKDAALPGEAFTGSESDLTGNLLAKAVTLREMGNLYEKLGNIEMAVEKFHRSLDCSARWREIHASRIESKSGQEALDALEGRLRWATPSCSLENVQLSQSCTSEERPKDQEGTESGGMELFIGPDFGGSAEASATNFYSSFFPPDAEEYDGHSHPSGASKSELHAKAEVSRANIEIATTLHQLAQMYRRQSQYDKALDAYAAASRGMKSSFGDYHPNVAAVLGNMGNLQKEIGDLDGGCETYKKVLKIECHRLGVSHPEVAISLHNVATIETARGNCEQAKAIYEKVLNLEKKLSGEEDISVAITASCLGDVYDRLGETEKAMESYQEALKIKTTVLGRHHIEVARMLHKLGKICFREKEYNLADSYISRAVLLYRLNKIDVDHEWIVDAHRIGADIDAALATGGGNLFEC